MNINILAKNLELTDSLKSLINKKVKKLDKYLREDTPVEVNLSIDGFQHICEITIPVAGIIVRGVETSDDMYTSIDGAIAKIEKQIVRHRTKLEKRWHGADQTPPVFYPQDVEYAEEEEGPQIVRTKRFAIKPLMLEEAALQLQLLGHDFFVFLNAETDEVNVLYKRKDGNLGLIEPTYDE